MAAEAKVQVSLEKIIHRTIRDTLQEIWEKHQIRVDNIRVDWREIETINEPIVNQLTELRVESVTFK